MRPATLLLEPNKDQRPDRHHIHQQRAMDDRGQQIAELERVDQAHERGRKIVVCAGGEKFGHGRLSNEA